METAVEIVDLKKSFGAHEVLRGAGLKVNSGVRAPCFVASIYWRSQQVGQ